jgi:hypothetical protein
LQILEKSQQVHRPKPSHARCQLAAPDDFQVKRPGEVRQDIEERSVASSPGDRTSSRFIAILGTEKIGKTRVDIARLSSHRMGKATETRNLTSPCSQGSQFRQEEFESQMKRDGRNDVVHTLVGRKDLVQATDSVSVECADG